MEQKAEVLNTQKNIDPSMDKEITLGFLMKFAMPTIIATVFMGLFGIVDGVFVSRVIDETALAATGLVTPFMTFVLAIGMMFGTGGNALVAKSIGEGQLNWARKDFSLIIWAAFIVTAAISLLGFIFPDIILNILGVNPDVYHLAHEYMMPMIPFLPFMGAGMMFQQFLMTEGKAHLGMIMTILGGAANMFLNWLLIYRLQMGLQGAAIATCVGYSIPSVFGYLYFTFNRKGLLYLVKPKLKFFVLWKASTNGLSEMITMLAFSITGVTMNNILMDLEGPMAVAASGIIMAGMGIFSNVFIGYASGIAPLISYNYGKNDTVRLKKIFNTSLTSITVMAIGVIILGLVLAEQFIQIYIRDPLMIFDGIVIVLPVYDMAYDGLRLLSFGYIFMGINAFGSVLFTALNNGVVSGVISLLRSFVFFIGCLLILPLFMGVDGVWVALPLAEVLGIFVTVYYFLKMRRVYHYA